MFPSDQIKFLSVEIRREIFMLKPLGSCQMYSMSDCFANFMQFAIYCKSANVVIFTRTIRTFLMKSSFAGFECLLVTWEEAPDRNIWKLQLVV